MKKRGSIHFHFRRRPRRRSEGRERRPGGDPCHGSFALLSSPASISPGSRWRAPGYGRPDRPFARQGAAMGNEPPPNPPTPTRREFLQTTGGAAAATVIAG